MTQIRTEIRRIVALAVPVVVAQLGLMMLGIVDSAMLGHFDVAAFDALALGRVWLIGTMLIGMGIVLGIDPLVSQAHGAGDSERARLALGRGLVLVCVVSVPLAILLCFTEKLLVWTGQSPALAHEAQKFAWVQIPGIPAWLGFSAFRTYAQARGFTRPAMWIAIAANGLNAFGNWILIWGHFGIPRLGVVGSGLSTTVTQLAMLASIAWFVRNWHRSRGEHFVFNRRMLDWPAMRQVLGQGAPVALMLMLEIWAFQIASLWSGLLGPNELAAHTIVLNLASLSFMVPLGISMGTSIRVGNLIGANEQANAQRAAWVGFGLGATAMSIFAAIFFLGRTQLTGIFTDDANVIAIGASLLPIAAAFQIFDGIQVVGCGILRGMGRPRPAAVFNLVGYYALALPIGSWLAFHRGLGVIGIWWGLSLGLALVALSCIAWVAVRGPKHARALHSESQRSEPLHG